MLALRLAAAFSLLLGATALQNGGKRLTSLPTRANTLQPADAASSLDSNLESPGSYAELEARAAYDRFRKSVKPSDMASLEAKAAALRRLYSGVKQMRRR